MHIFITSTSAWAAHASACTNIAHRLLASPSVSAQTLVIDLNTVKREHEQAISPGATVPEPVSMRSWIDGFYHDRPVLDVEKAHRAAKAICVEGAQVAVIDASSLDTDLIDRTMNQLRRAFYGCPHWPGVLVLVVEDLLLHDVAGFAGRVFFIQPEVTGQSRINTLLSHIKRFSKMEGIFGLRHKFLSTLNAWINRPRRRVAVTEEK